MILNIINTCMIFGLAVVVFLMIRQIGILVQHVAPSGYREDTAGPREGENIERLSLSEFRDVVESNRYCLVLFGSKSCRTCQAIKDGGLDGVAKAWSGECSIIYMFDEDLDESEIGNLGEGKAFAVRSGGRLHRSELAIPYVPFAIVIDKNFKVVTKGLVNHPSHVESLIEVAKERNLDAS